MEPFNGVMHLTRIDVVRNGVCVDPNFRCCFSCYVIHERFLDGAFLFIRAYVRHKHDFSH